jgi:hypothetical protein
MVPLFLSGWDIFTRNNPLSKQYTSLYGMEKAEQKRVHSIPKKRPGYRHFSSAQALPIIIPVALIIGSMILVQFAKISGQYDLGKITILLIIRELGPMITALLVGHITIRHRRNH